MNKYGFGLIGCGRIAQNHLKAITSLENASLAAICDNDPGRLAEAGGQYGGRAYADYRELLRDPDVAIVNICTPSGLHAECCIAAAQSGCAVCADVAAGPAAPDASSGSCGSLSTTDSRCARSAPASAPARSPVVSGRRPSAAMMSTSSAV